MHENLSIKYNAHTRRSNLSTHVPPPTSSGKPCCSLTLLSSSPPPQKKTPSPLLPRRPPDQSSLGMCAAPHRSAYPIAAEPSRWTLQSSFVYLTHLSSGTHNNPLHCMFVSPLFRTKERRERGGGEGREWRGLQKQKKTKETIKRPLLPMNPVLAVSQLQIL